ncbi:facilitated trehalose transporter Tret1-2 homolog isoform X2 [Chrysoperla carnea]|nr:facilitated trehalose transporter Tret1-2 homolog isoform X2 [Chrysoperla carnea]
MFLCGMHFVWTSPSLPKLYANDSTIPTTVEDGSWMASIELFGDIPAAPVSAFAADYFGRKMTMLLTAIPFLGSWLLIAFAKDTSTLITARFVAGFATGCIFTMLPMYIGEISDPDIRGSLSNGQMVMFDVGSLFFYSVAPWISIKLMALIGSIFPLIFFATFFFMPESPYYYLMKEDPQKAKESLKRLRGVRNIKESDFQELIKSMEIENTQSSKWSDLCNSYLKGLIIVLGLKTLQIMSGVYAILTYAELIFDQAGGIFSGKTSSVLFGIVQFLSSLGSLLFVDGIGRRPLLIISCIGCFLALSAQTVYFYLQLHNLYELNFLGWIPISSLLFYTMAHGIGLGPIPYLITGEIFPTNIKAKALCVLDLYAALIEFIVLKNYQIIANSYGSHVPFGIFSISCIVGIVFVLLMVPETKGQTLEQIQEIMKSKIHVKPKCLTKV